MDKKFKAPELTIVEFANEDIIVTSGEETLDEIGGTGDLG